MELSIVNMKGEAAGTIQVPDGLFNQPMNQALVHQAIIMYNINQRQGTQSARTRGEISGGGHKPWRQKYTGRARQGSTRAPQWRHGGIVFAPKPRDHRVDMPVKMRRLALKCVLSEKVRQSALVVLDKFSIEKPNTKQMVDALNALGAGKSVLLVTRDPEANVIASARNLDGVRTLPVQQINAAELLKHASVIMTADAIKRAEEIWAGDGVEAVTEVKAEAQAAPPAAEASTPAAAAEPTAPAAPAPTEEPSAAPKPRRARKPRATAETPAREAVPPAAPEAEKAEGTPKTGEAKQ